MTHHSNVYSPRGRTSSIAVFDSGVGGLSVWREIVARLPREHTLYFADTVHCPYGPRRHAEIRALSRAVVRFLLSRGAKLVVVACNTISAASLHDLRAEFPVPIVGMEPAVKPAAEHTGSRKVGVIATEATIQGELFARLVERFAADVTVFTRVCPGLVERVEAGRTDDAQTEAMLRGYLRPMLEAGIDSLVLGCTHYPFLRPAIERVVGPAVELVDPGPAVARQTERVLLSEGLANESPHRGEHTFFTSGDPARFAALVEQLLGATVEVRGVCWRGGEVVLSQTADLG